MKIAKQFIVSSLFFVGSCSSLSEGNVEPNNQNPVCHNNHPIWSPNGNEIVFDGRRGDAHEIFIYNFTTKDVKQLSNSPGRDAHPYWSPTAEKIVFQSPRATEIGFLVDIYSMDADGSNVLRLTKNPGFSGVPTWSPDGELIVFQFKPMEKDEDFEKNQWNLYTVKPDGSMQQQLTNLDANDQVPGWAADSQSIIFHSDRTGNNQLYTMNIDGSELRQITFTEFDDSSGSFSPDGKRIAYKSSRNGTRELYVMNRDGGAPLMLTEGYSVNGIPSWSPDSRQLAFHSNKSGNGELYVIEIESKNIRKIAPCDLTTVQ